MGILCQSLNFGLLLPRMKVNCALIIVKAFLVSIADQKLREIREQVQNAPGECACPTDTRPSEGARGKNSRAAQGT